MLFIAAVRGRHMCTRNNPAIQLHLHIFLRTAITCKSLQNRCSIYFLHMNPWPYIWNIQIVLISNNAASSYKHKLSLELTVYFMPCCPVVITNERDDDDDDYQWNCGMLLKPDADSSAKPAMPACGRPSAGGYCMAVYTSVQTLLGRAVSCMASTAM